MTVGDQTIRTHRLGEDFWAEITWEETVTDPARPRLVREFPVAVTMWGVGTATFVGWDLNGEVWRSVTVAVDDATPVTYDLPPGRETQLRNAEIHVTLQAGAARFDPEHTKGPGGGTRTLEDA